MKNSHYLVQPCSENKKFSRYQLPEYLLKNYWWAYLSPLGMKIFDHPFIVNRILWGQYQKIAEDTVALIAKKEATRVAGISCAYGDFFPLLVQEKNIEQLYIFDIAPIQVDKMQEKLAAQSHKSHFFIGNAEQIALQSESVDCSVLFFLLHEMPEPARKSVINEAIRITEKGGRLVVADYAPLTSVHLFHKNPVIRTVFEKLEPFLANFRHTNLITEITEQAISQGRTITLNSTQHYWHKFYRLLEITID